MKLMFNCGGLDGDDKVGFLSWISVIFKTKLLQFAIF